MDYFGNNARAVDLDDNVTHSLIFRHFHRPWIETKDLPVMHHSDVVALFINLTVISKH